MAQNEKTYSEVKEAEGIVKELCSKYGDVLWAVKPEDVVVLGIDNKERGKKNKTLAKIIPIKGLEKVIMNLNKIKVQYAIEIYWSDYNKWSDQLKQWIIFHELLHISSEEGRTIKHDVMDFRIMVDKVGVDWNTPNKSLPNLLSDDVKFNKDLIPSSVEALEAQEDEDEEKDENDAKPKE